MSETNKQLVRNLYDGITKGDFDSVTPLFDDNVAYHGSGGDEQQGPTDTVTGRVYKAAFPDLRVEVLQLVGDGDHVAALIRGSGTFTGELMGMPPTGNSFDLTWVNLLRIRDGRIVEVWEIYDTADLMSQLGLA